MKKFAIFLPSTEQAQIIEGQSASVTRKPDGLRVVISQNGKRISFNGVVIFCEVSDKIELQ